MVERNGRTIIAQSHDHSGELTLVPIGPLTNIAEALKRDPSLPSRIKQVVLMGGAAHVPGNVSPAAEANIVDDPLAANMVFAADWDVVMMGLDATMQVPLRRADVERLSGVRGAFLKQASGQYFDNDIERFAPPHADALDEKKCAESFMLIDRTTLTS